MSNAMPCSKDISSSQAALLDQHFGANSREESPAPEELRIEHPKLYKVFNDIDASELIDTICTPWKPFAREACLVLVE